MTVARVMRGDARALQLPDASVDLIVTSPPYFGLRDYGHDGQIGAEPTPAEYIAGLIGCTREMMRVLKPSGSIFVNLGDKYNSAASNQQSGSALVAGAKARGARHIQAQTDGKITGGRGRTVGSIGPKSLMLLPERYRIACVDELGLIARAVLVWSKPNGLPESVTDRVRRSHEDWVHLTKSPRYFSAVDEIREVYTGDRALSRRVKHPGDGKHAQRAAWDAPHPLGKLPGSVWEIPTAPLIVPPALAVDHFAAFPMEWPRRLILGWSPREVCTACDEGRQPVTDAERKQSPTSAQGARDRVAAAGGAISGGTEQSTLRGTTTRMITGYACACPDTTAPSTPGVVLDPFGGTGTVALVAAMHGRQGISVDASWEYTRLAEWRVSDPKQRARALAPARPGPPAGSRGVRRRKRDAS